MKWSNIKNMFRFRKKYKRLDIETLPSQNLFYPSDIKLYIKRASKSDINVFKDYYKGGDVISILSAIKYIVEHNIKLNKKYSYKDILSTDMLYIFFQIVSYTKDEPIVIYYDNDIELELNEYTFNYFDTAEYDKYYNEEKKCFEIDGYQYSLPTNGIEDAVTEFIYKNHKEYTGYDYKFQYFLTDKNEITHDEIVNLLEIFNYDMKSSQIEKIDNIVDEFSPFINYSLITPNDIIIPLDGVDLEFIWGYD